MSPIVVWSIALLLIVAFAYYATRLVSQSDEENLHDTGLAIMEFGRAFPQEAIRSLHATANGDAIFVRLHDNKSGLMRNKRNHYACHLIEPGRVRVTSIATAKGFFVEFLDSPTQNGEFFFKSEKEAAEVSLWLLNNYVAPADRDIPAEGSLA